MQQAKGAMERNCWSRMRNSDHGRTLGDNNKGRDPWVFNSHYHGGDDLLEGHSWPPRSYTCSYCKREFKSAQALGGHMNVHRRDRARLRQSPPWEQQPQSSSNNLNPNPNPNPSPNFSSFISPPTKLPTFTYQVPSVLNSSVSCLSSSPLAYSDQVKIPITSPLLDCSRDGEFTNTMKALKGFKQEDECNILKNGKMVMLDLEIGLRSNDVNEDLDLELRLGYS